MLNNFLFSKTFVEFHSQIIVQVRRIRTFSSSFGHASSVFVTTRLFPPRSRPLSLSAVGLMIGFSSRSLCCCSRWRDGGVAWRGLLRVGLNKSGAPRAREWRRESVSVRGDKCPEGKGSSRMSYKSGLGSARWKQRDHGGCSCCMQREGRQTGRATQTHGGKYWCMADHLKCNEIWMHNISGFLYASLQFICGISPFFVGFFPHTDKMRAARWIQGVILIQE